MNYLKPLLATATIALSTMMPVAQAATGFTLSPSTNNLYVSTAGEVMLTFISKTASYSNDLFLTGTSGPILNNQTAVAGTQYSLGNFAAGTELSFEIFVNTTGYRFSTGAASLNPDNVVHGAFYEQLGQPLMVGFEDILHGGDLDYDDLVFSLTNVTVAAVPEPQTYGMMLLGLGMLGAAFKRKKTA